MITPAIPTVFTPEDVAKQFGWSPRKLRVFARELGACRVLGNRMVFTQNDIDAILEASKPCPSSYTSAVTKGFGTTVAPLKGSDYEELQAYKAKLKPKSSSSNSRLNGSNRRRSGSAEAKI